MLEKIYKVNTHRLYSKYLFRTVTFDCYVPQKHFIAKKTSLLLINDGQDLEKMNFQNILNELTNEQKIDYLFCIGIHCSWDRKNEYGTADVLDYKGRGYKAKKFSEFVFNELLPFIRKEYNASEFKDKNYTGFSLGALTAFDIAWKYPQHFCKVGAISGSFWWRNKNHLDDDFDENKNRIMQNQIAKGKYNKWQNFFFEVGTLDEVEDRNNNGVIDSIDDTRAIIDELKKLGYKENEIEIKYLELKDGKHNVETWARVMPIFLEWGWGINHQVS